MSSAISELNEIVTPHLNDLFERFATEYKTYRQKKDCGETVFKQKPIVQDYYNEAKNKNLFVGNGEKFSKLLKQWYFNKYDEELMLRNPNSFKFDENMVRDLTHFIDTYFEKYVEHSISTIPNDYRLENYPESVKQFIGCFVNEKTNKLDYSDKVNNKRIRNKCSALLKAKCETAYSSPVKMIGLSGQCQNCGHNLYGGQCMVCDYRSPQKKRVEDYLFQLFNRTRVSVREVREYSSPLQNIDAYEFLLRFTEHLKEDEFIGTDSTKDIDGDNEEDETEEVEN